MTDWWNQYIGATGFFVASIIYNKKIKLRWSKSDEGPLFCSDLIWQFVKLIIYDNVL